MRTREESLNNFMKLVDELIASRYLFANSKVFEVITAINSSKLLSDTFNYFVDSYDFQTALVDAFIQTGEDKYFVLPERNTDVLAFVYSLLREVNYKNLQLTDLLDFFDPHKNYDTAYSNFANIVLVPFKSYAYQIGMQMINSTQTKEEAAAMNKIIEEEPIKVDDTEKLVEQAVEKVGSYENSLATLVRLLDLERLSVKDSRISQADVTELMYILDLFEAKIREKDNEKIKLIYLAYLYAVRPFKKLKSNIKRITEILIDEQVI